MPRLIALVSVGVLAACSSQPQGGNGAAGSGSAATTGSAVGTAGSASAAGAAGSGSQAAAPPPAPKPATTLEQVQREAPEGAKVARVELAVPGIELFAVTDAAPRADDDAGQGKLVGVAGGRGGQLLEGRDLMKAAIAGKLGKPMLARLALWVAGDDGKVLDRATSREQKKAKVGPPAIARGALTFWVWTTDLPPMLERGRVDLATGGVELVLQPGSPAAGISNAMTTLASNHVSRHAMAIKTLADACAEPRARQALISALASHPRIKTRVVIAEEARRCGATAVDGLITAMEQDKSAVVRSEAARALGRIGDSRARPALAKAVRGQDANLAYAAGNALKKLN